MVAKRQLRPSPLPVEQEYGFGRWHTGQVSTDDQKLTAIIQGEALKFARDAIPQEMLDRLAAAAEGRDDLRTRTAGELAGFWMANPAIGRGEDLIAAGLMLISGPVDGDQLLDAVRTGYERGQGSLGGYDPSR